MFVLFTSCSGEPGVFRKGQFGISSLAADFVALVDPRLAAGLPRPHLRGSRALDPGEHLRNIHFR